MIIGLRTTDQITFHGIRHVIDAEKWEGLINAKSFNAFAWSFALMVLSIMLLQENYASPIPAFVITWMSFEVILNSGTLKLKGGTPTNNHGSE